ncbi:MAG: peptidoglycan editing factor PgeF [Terriglobia bacterium]|nr:peptidoglycan editing factor PgeF [Terriglobia bacterium]
MVSKRNVPKRRAAKRSLSTAEIETSLADAGFSRKAPMAAPYAIKQQRAKRDRERSGPAPKTGKLQILRAKSLGKFPWLVHGFSTRQGGVTSEYGRRQLNLGVTKEDTHENVARNRELFARALGAQTDGHLWPLVQTHQIHSPIVHRVSCSEPHPAAGDGLITNTPGVLIAVKVADCIPVIAVDPVRRAVGVFHAGWRGTMQRILQKGIGEMRRQFGSDPSDILVAIGAGISVCCYQVGDEVLEQFHSQFSYADELIEEVFDSHSLHVKYPLLFLNQRAPGHGELPKVPHLDLIKANTRQAVDAGVPEQNIEALNLCTACRTDIFFSHRKEHVTGRMMAAVGIKGGS